MVLERLEGSDRPAELHPVAVIGDRAPQRLPGEADEVPRREHRTPVEKIAKDGRGRARQPLPGDAVEHHRSRAYRAVVVFQPGHGDPRQLRFHQVQPDLASRFHGGHHDDLCGLGVLDRQSRSGQPARLVSRDPYARGIVAAGRPARRHRGHERARGDSGQQGPLLLVRTRKPQRLTREHGRQPRPGYGSRAERAGNHLGIHQAKTEAVVLRGDADSEPSIRADGLPQLGGVTVAVLVLEHGTDGCQVEPVGEVGTDGFTQSTLLVGECEVHGWSYRRRPERSSGQPEEPLGDDVTLHLRGATPDRDRTRPHRLVLHTA